MSLFRNGRRNLICWAVFVALCFSCASGASREAGYFTVRERTLHSGLRVVTGGPGAGAPVWTAVVADEALLGISPPVMKDGGTVSVHSGRWFADESRIAVLDASPHAPLRWRSGFHQAVSGFYRWGGETVSTPDRRHDALGIDSRGMPRLLPPSMQAEWQGDAAGGFYAVLLDGVPQQPVSIRDAVAAVGWSGDGRRIIFLAGRGRDGEGLSYWEAGRILSELGAENGLAMDGGGSTRLSWKENGRIRNFPPGLIYRAMPNQLLLSAP